VNHGYEGDVGFVATVDVPGLGDRAERVHLRAEGSWLLCREVCVPGSGTAEATVAFVPGSTAPDPVAPWLRALPAPFALGGGTMTLDGDQLQVTLPGPGPFEVFPSIPLERAWSPVVHATADGALVLTGPLAKVPAGAYLLVARGPEHAGFLLDLPETPR
jgi:hypothetical protein